MEIEKKLDIIIPDDALDFLFNVSKKPPIFHQYFRNKKLEELGICKRCHKKQIMSTSGYWIDWDLTKEEERDIKLKELGIS